MLLFFNYFPISGHRKKRLQAARNLNTSCFAGFGVVFCFFPRADKINGQALIRMAEQSNYSIKRDGHLSAFLSQQYLLDI